MTALAGIAFLAICHSSTLEALVAKCLGVEDAIAETNNFGGRFTDLRALSPKLTGCLTVAHQCI